MIGRSYQVTVNHYSSVPPHNFVHVTHCTRCYLQVMYPGQYDYQGNPIPAVPASPGLTQPQVQSFSPVLTPAQQRLLDGFYAAELTTDQQTPADEPEYKEEAPGFIGHRGTYKVEKLDGKWKDDPCADPDVEKTYYAPVEWADANLVGSKTNLEEDGHLPCIDLGLPAHLEPSTKPDHYHLYINKVVQWDKYVKLLEALYECGLINEGFKEMSIKRGQTYVRRPGVFKVYGEGDSG